jgi:hypothetical protein
MAKKYLTPHFFFFKPKLNVGEEINCKNYRYSFKFDQTIIIPKIANTNRIDDSYFRSQTHSDTCPNT